MTGAVGRCKICRGYYRLDRGRIPPHPHLGTGNPCRGRWPDPEPDEYTVGFDHHPADVSGGLPERDRRRF
jgi:hypothetical protein